MNKPLQSDMVYYSSLNDWFTDNAFRSFSIKFVVSGKIYYKIDHTEHVIEGGHYMLACQQPDVKAYFESKQGVQSFCIDICPNTISQVFSSLTDKNPDMENYLSGYFKTPEFYESIYQINNHPLDGKLRGLARLLENESYVNLTDEWFFEVAENIVEQEFSNYMIINSLNSLRLSTRKEILRRLHIAKEYIQDNFLTIQNIAEIARACNMSEYHFFRCFKRAFGLTPNTLLTDLKMQFAKKALSENPELKVTDVAMVLNYPDVYTFSKAFKRYFSVPPTSIRVSAELA